MSKAMKLPYVFSLGALCCKPGAGPIGEPLPCDALCYSHPSASFGAMAAIAAVNACVCFKIYQMEQAPPGDRDLPSTLLSSGRNIHVEFAEEEDFTNDELGKECAICCHSLREPSDREVLDTQREISNSSRSIFWMFPCDIFHYACDREFANTEREISSSSHRICRMLPCERHIFHYACFENMRQSQSNFGSCPECRTELTGVRVYDIDF